MIKKITIVCSEEVPVKHLLNNINYEIYEASGNENVFTMVGKDDKGASTLKPYTVTTGIPIDK